MLRSEIVVWINSERLRRGTLSHLRSGRKKWLGLADAPIGIYCVAT